MAPREHDVVESAPFRVAAELGRVDWVVKVGVLLEGTGVNDLILREGGTDDKGVSLETNESQTGECERGRKGKEGLTTTSHCPSEPKK